jgi:hypothetical protein
VLAHASAPTDNLAVAVNFDPQPLSAVVGRCGLFEQCLSAGVRNVVFGHD